MKTPKRLHFRQLADGKVSIGEYYHAKWFNVVSPLKFDDETAITALRALITRWKAVNKREVVATFYNKGTHAEIVVSKLGLEIK